MALCPCHGATTTFLERNRNQYLCFIDFQNIDRNAFAVFKGIVIMGTASSLVFLDKWPKSVRALERELKNVLTPFRSGRSWRQTGFFDFGWSYQSLIWLPSHHSSEDLVHKGIDKKICEKVFFDGKEGFMCPGLDGVSVDQRAKMDVESFIVDNGITRFQRNSTIDWNGANDIASNESIIFPWGFFYNGRQLVTYEDNTMLDKHAPWKALQQDPELLARFYILALKNGCHFEVCFREV